MALHSVIAPRGFVVRPIDKGLWMAPVFGDLVIQRDLNITAYALHG